MKFHFIITSAFFCFSSEWIQQNTMWSTTQLDKMKLYLEACVPQGSSQFRRKQRFYILIFLSYDGIHLSQTKSAEIRSTHGAARELEVLLQ